MLYIKIGVWEDEIVGLESWINVTFKKTLLAMLCWLYIFYAYTSTIIHPVDLYRTKNRHIKWGKFVY